MILNLLLIFVPGYFCVMPCHVMPLQSSQWVGPHFGLESLTRQRGAAACRCLEGCPLCPGAKDGTSKWYHFCIVFCCCKMDQNGAKLHWCWWPPLLKESMNQLNSTFFNRFLKCLSQSLRSTTFFVSYEKLFIFSADLYKYNHILRYLPKSSFPSFLNKSSELDKFTGCPSKE